MRTSLFLLFSLYFLASRSQTGIPTINDHINSEKTSAHVNIKGTNIYLIPPKGFKLSETLNGFIKNDSAFISSYLTTDKEQIENAPGFERPKEIPGINILSFRRIRVKDYNGALLVYQEHPGLVAYSLVFGDTSFRAFISVVFIPDDLQTKNAIIHSLNSLHYEG